MPGTLIRGANPPGRNFNLKMVSSIPSIDGIQGRFIGSHLSANDEGRVVIVNVLARKFVTYFGSNGFWFDCGNRRRAGSSCTNSVLANLKAMHCNV
jgi:hypothetical protein